MILAWTVTLDIWSILLLLIVGGLTGWLATIIFGSKRGLAKYVLIGIVGTVFGGILSNLLGVSGGFWGTILNFLIGVLTAGVFIVILRFFKVIK